MMRETDPRKRVVVTGLGVVSSIGIGWQEFWKNLLAGKSGISKVEAFDTSGHERHYGGEVKGFCSSRYIKTKLTQNVLGRSSQLLLVATKLAIDDSGHVVDEYFQKKAGVCVGTTTGEIGVLEKFDDEAIIEKTHRRHRLESLLFPSAVLGINVAKHFKLRGYNAVFSNACASGNYSIGRGYDLVKSGRCNCVIAGGSDGFSRILYTGFNRLHAVATMQCKPFDLSREGMIPGEGAGIVLMESLDTALRRKAKIYAEVLGYGMSCDAMHMTSPDPVAIAKAITQSLNKSGAQKSDIGYVSAHGTGTKENDRAECAALRNVFLDQLKEIPVSSIKSMLGHAMGAAAAIEAVTCSLVAYYKKIPPTINFASPDPECDVDCVPMMSKKLLKKTIINNSAAFGGNNFVTVLRRME